MQCWKGINLALDSLDAARISARQVGNIQAIFCILDVPAGQAKPLWPWQTLLGHFPQSSFLRRLEQPGHTLMIQPLARKPPCKQSMKKEVQLSIRDRLTKGYVQDKMKGGNEKEILMRFAQSPAIFMLPGFIWTVSCHVKTVAKTFRYPRLPQMLAQTAMPTWHLLWLVAADQKWACRPATACLTLIPSPTSDHLSNAYPQGSPCPRCNLAESFLISAYMPHMLLREYWTNGKDCASKKPKKMLIVSGMASSW